MFLINITMVNYTCETCNFTTILSWVYKRHIASKKHIKLIANTQLGDTKNDSCFSCSKCSKKYTSRSGLYKHKCQIKEETSVPNHSVLDTIDAMRNKISLLENEIMYLRNQSSGNIEVTNHITNNNFYFNFLNTHCKDAMNIDQFVKNIVITNNDIGEFVVQPHFCDAFSRFIIRQLEKIPTIKRPLHCINPDNTFAIFAVKMCDKWTSEDLYALEDYIRSSDMRENDMSDNSMVIPMCLDKMYERILDSYQQDVDSEPTWEEAREKMESGASFNNKMKTIMNIKTCGTCDLIIA